MPRGKRILILAMWITGGLAVAAAVACMVIANFFFPSADQSDYLDQLENPPRTTFFHPNEPAAIRAWKVSLTVLGASMGTVLLLALGYGICYPPSE